MKVRISFDLDWEASDIAEKCHDNLADQWLSDYDMHWLVEEGRMTGIKVEALQPCLNRLGEQTKLAHLFDYA